MTSRLAPLLIGWFVVVATAVLFILVGSGETKTIHLGPLPQATATPQHDTVFMGLPRPAVAPSCAAGVLGLHGSTLDSCVYACEGASRVIIDGAPCAVPTP